MTDPTNAATIDPLAPAAAPQGGGTPPPVTPPVAAATAPEPARDPQTGRYVPADRFDAATAQKWEAIRKADRLEQELKLAQDALAEFQARQQGGDPAAHVAPRPVSQSDLDRRASEIAAQRIFDQRCNESVAEGKRAHADFMDAVESLKQVSPHTAPGPNGIPVPVLPTQFIEAALETGRGHEVLYALGKDRTEADRILSLSPTKQAIEIARLADKLGGTAPAAQTPLDPAAVRATLSSAPPPVRSVVGGHGATAQQFDATDTKTPLDQWLRARQAEVDAQLSARKASRF